MGVYVFRRVLQSMVVLFFVSLIVFILAHAMPGNPFEVKIYSSLAERLAVQQAIHHYGLDQPVVFQYVHWVNGMVHGFLGFELDGTPISQTIGFYIRNSLLLMVPAWVISLLTAVPWAIFNSKRPYGLSDNTSVFLGFVGFSIPAFWLGFMLQQVFAMQLFWLPPSSIHSPSRTGQLSDLIAHMILPVTTIAIGLVVGYLKYFRSSLLEVLPSDYIQTARAKGASERRVIYRHALRNALIPIITIFAMDLSTIIGGSAVVETVFGWKGMGWLLVNSARNRHYPDIMAIVMIIAVVVVIANLLADTLYAIVDPRVRIKT